MKQYSRLTIEQATKIQSKFIDDLVKVADLFHEDRDEFLWYNLALLATTLKGLTLKDYKPKE